MFLCAAERFRNLLKAQGVLLTFRHNFEIFFIGQFFNFVLPGGVGGDAVKAFYIHKDVGELAETSPYTVLFDRLIGFFVLSSMAVLVVIFHWSQFQMRPQLRALSYIVICEFSLLTSIMATGYFRRSREMLLHLAPKKFNHLHKFTSKIVKSFEFYAANPKYVLRGLAWGICMQTFSVLALAAVGAAVHIETVPLSAYFFIGPLGFMLASLPISPGGIGVGQAGFYFFFNAYLGHRSSLGPIAITVVQIITLAWSMIGLYFYFARRGGIAKPLTASPQSPKNLSV